MSAPGSSSSWKGPEGSGKSTLLQPLAERMREAGWIRSSSASRAARRPAEIGPQGGARSGAPSVGPMAELFLYLAARSDLVRDGDPAGAGGRAGWCSPTGSRCRPRPTRWPVGGSRPRWCAPANRAAAGRARARPDPDSGPAARARPGAAGGGGQAARSAGRGRARSSTGGWWSYYLAVQGAGVRHLDGCLPPDRLLQAAWAEVGRRSAPRRSVHRGNQLTRTNGSRGWPTREHGHSAGAEAGMKQRWGVIVLVAVISFLSGGWLLQRGVASGGNVYQQARLFDDVLGHVSAYYVDSHGGDRSLREGHARHAGAAQGSLLGPADRRRLQGAHRADLGQLRRPRHPDRRARRLDHRGGSAARDAGRARRRRRPATRSSRWTASPPRAGRTTRR